MQKMRVSRAASTIDSLRKEIKKGIVGQDNVIDSVIRGIFCNGHVLLESVPGLAKTMLAKIMSFTIRDASFQRVQFTPDLLPSDITGITAYDEHRGFYTIQGPVFTNILLADEINRAPPKVQSALLQAMQERQVTIGKETFSLPSPFFVIATQNPVEQQGVYPLSAAQVDRFIVKVLVKYPSEEEETDIIDSNMEVRKLASFDFRPVLSRHDLLETYRQIKKVRLSEKAKSYIYNIVNATRNPKGYGIVKGKYIQYGASPRASIYLALTAKATALMDGRDFVMPEDIRQVIHEVLRHRIILTYEAKALEMSADGIIDEVVEKVEVG